MILCATTLAVLLVIGGVEENPGPGVEAEKIMRVLCSGFERILKSGTQCGTFGVGSIIAVVMLKLKWQRAENGSVTSVDRRGSDCYRESAGRFNGCRSERLRLLQGKLQGALMGVDRRGSDCYREKCRAL